MIAGICFAVLVVVFAAAVVGVICRRRRMNHPGKTQHTADTARSKVTVYLFDFLYFDFFCVSAESASVDESLRNRNVSGGDVSPV